VHIKAILLDFGGTLDSDGKDWYDQFHEIFRSQGMQLDRKAFQELAREAGRNMSRHDDIKHLGHEDTVRRLMAEIRKLLPADEPLEPDAAADAFLDRCRPWLSRNVEVVRRLSQRFRLGVLSNNWGNAEGWCREYGYLPYLEVVVDYGLVGVSKPEPGIFEVALERLALPPASVAYVGDKLEVDMVGAKNAGLMTVWIRHEGGPVLDPDGTVDFVVPALPGLLGISSNWTG